MIGSSRTQSSFATNRICRPGRLGGLVLLIVVLGSAGCGSSSTSSTGATTGASAAGSTSTAGSSSTGITKSEFLAKANAICVQGNAVIEPARAKLGLHPNEQEVTPVVLTVVAPAIQNEINALKALGAPAGEEATVTNMLNLAQEGLDELERGPALLEIGDPFLHFQQIAHPYGLTSCAPRL